MTILYCAQWVLPVSSAPIANGAIAVEADSLIEVGSRMALSEQFPEATIRDFGNSAIIPGLINTHSHLELTVMRGFLENEETDFFAWLKKLTVARVERMTPDDLYVSALWGACEAVRAGITCVADASDSASESMKAISEVGLRGVVFQESFGPDPRMAQQNFEKLCDKVMRLRAIETALVKCGVSPHAPYTVSGPQLELISRFAIDEGLPLMMHAAETVMEVSLMLEGLGPFADGLRSRGIEWRAPRVSTIRYLNDLGVLQTRPLLAHCINVDEVDIEIMRETKTKVAHCPKSNAKLGHGHAPLRKIIDSGIALGLGSDSVASNNTCDLLEEARFALLLARSTAAFEKLDQTVSAEEILEIATIEGARALGSAGRIGELKKGMQADFAIVALDQPHQVPSYDPVNTLIFASSGRDVKLTVVAGQEIYREGRVTNVDEERLGARLKEVANKLAS